MTRLNHIVGKKFGRLLVLRFSANRYGVAHFWCRCDCGKEKEIHGSCINRGKIKSCGCLAVEKARERLIKHGESRTKLYKVWRHMIERCTMPKCAEYPRYGGRGIFVCKEWLDDYFVFKADVEDGFGTGLELDRIDNDGGYYKGNVRWSTHRKNNNNKRTSCYVEYDGQIKTASEWAEIYKLNPGCIAGRVRSGFKGADAIWGIYFLKHGKHINRKDKKAVSLHQKMHEANNG